MTKANTAGALPDKKPKAKKAPGKHLHKIITERVVDKDGKHQGYVHSHVYKDKHDSPMEDPARPMGTSSDAAEAGDHVAEQFGSQEGAGAGAPDDEQAEGGAPDDEQGEGQPGA